MSSRRSPADRRIARLNSSLSVRISANPCFHARYEPATRSSSTFGGVGNSTASGSVRPARPCATGELPSVGSGASRSVVHASQRSSRASPGRSSQRHVEPHPARVRGARDVGVDRHGLGARLAEREVRPAPHVVEAVVAERHAVRPHGDREVRGRARLATQPRTSKMSAASAASSRSSSTSTRLLGVVDDLDPLLEHRAVEQPVAPDAQLLRGERVLGADLVLEVAVDPRVGQLDRPVVVAAGRRLEQDRPLAVDPQDRARQPARVALVQAEAAGVGVDVAERVGQQVQVALLEDLDGAEVGRLDDRADDGLDEAGRLRT